MSDNSDAFEDRKSEMLEDEEMPTFVSISSKDISLPYNSDNNIQHLPIDDPEPPNSLNVNEHVADDYEGQSRSHTTEEREDESNNENEEGSVYVLSSSGDDADNGAASSRSYDEDIDDEEEEDDEDEDIDDMDDMDAEEEEVEVAGEMLCDYSEEEIERDDVMSIDMALGRNKRKVINQQKRSQSLQDLSDSCSLRQQKSFITGGNRYNRVQSKVKRYIQDLKAINRRSAERRRKSMEETNKFEEYKTKASQDEENENYQKSTGRRSIKGYAEQALKDLEVREEVIRADENMSIQEDGSDSLKRNNTVQSKDVPKTEKNENHQNNYKKNDENDIGRLKKLKMNGELVNEDLKGIKVPKGVTLNYILNGQTQGQNILDVRSIGYDEYMRGSSNSSTDKNALSVETDDRSSPDEADTNNLEITNVRSEALLDADTRDAKDMEETQMEVAEHEKNLDKVVEPKINENKNNETLTELALIQTQLNQKTTQCKDIREAYEKTLSENFELKQELEDLKKTLHKLTTKKPAPQLVEIAIQTDPPSNSSEPKHIPTTGTFLNPKLSTSSMGSAVSYNDRWAESLPTSNGSSIPPPNLTALSSAEDSFIGVASTPSRTPRQPSHAFQTSSRIIKMLSSLTQRRSKVDGAINGDENLPNVFGKTVGSPGIPNFSSPINHRSSNKRKATEMPENSNFLQPAKIPHTASGSHRLHRRTKSEFKDPGDYIKPTSQPFTPQSTDTNRAQENEDDSQREDDIGEDLDSRVKCFTYRDDENSLERSFLIQAEEEVKSQDGNKDGERTPLGVVRECGPYLLGNVEVRMTEINGTINIWGKEVNQETSTENEHEEEDVESELTERGNCNCWQKTPNNRHLSNGPLSCSTNKKQKIPSFRLNESGCFKSCSSPSTSIPKGSLAVDDFRERHQIRNSIVPEAVDHCQNCDTHCHSRGANKSKRFTNFEEEENFKNVSKNYCGCNSERNTCDYSPCDRVCRHCHNDRHCALSVPRTQGSGRCSRLNSLKDNEQLKTKDNLDRNHSSRFNSNCGEENGICHHGMRKNSDFEDDDIFKRPSTSNARVNNSCCRSESCRSQNSSCMHQSTDPLLLHDSSEVKRRRSSGKRVRGILMDFLRGCGDCRVTNSSDNKVSPSVIPQIRIRSSTPPPTLLTPTQQQKTNNGSTTNRCSHTECCVKCARRLEMAAEIETQLEIFGAEMERLRSRSQAVLGMLNTLHSAETN